jgi:sialate O-acetylesterase
MSDKRIGFGERTVFVGSLVLVLVCAAVSFADVKLPAVISDNMVIQRGMKVPIWGWAEPGEKIFVTVTWKRSTAYDATADKDGKWMVKVKTPKPGGPYDIFIEGNNKITLKDVMVGEVWVCSGQSNMQWSMKRSANAEQEIVEADYPKIRLFTVERNTSGQPLDDCVGSWSACSPNTVPGFSAVAYFFGRQLHKERNVPIGLINTSWGGTRIEPWTPPVGFASVPKLDRIQNEIEQADSQYCEAVAGSLDTIETWVCNPRRNLVPG